MRLTRIAALALLAVCLAATPLLAAGAGGFSIHPSTELTTPQRTVSVAGQDYHISSVGRTRVGDGITLTVDAPANAGVYSINVYDAHKRVVASKRVKGDGTYTFTGNFSAGTYLAGVEHGGTLAAVQPVVVASYGVTANASGSVARGHRLSVDATLTGSTARPNRVDVVVFNGTYNETVTATRVGDGAYDVLVSTSDLAPGEYSYYAGARGNDRVAGHLELLGVSDRHTVTVTASSGSENGSGSTGGSGSGSTGGSGSGSVGSAGGPVGAGTGTATTTTNDTTTGTNSTNGTTTTNGTNGTTTTSTTETTARATTGSHATTTHSATTTSSSVITPSNATATDAPSATGGSSPGFGAGTALAALSLVAALALAFRRARG